MSKDLADRTRKAIKDLDNWEPGMFSPNACSELFDEWLDSTDAKLIGNLARTRVLVHDLNASQQRLLDAIACAYDLIQHEPRLDVDDPQDNSKKVKDARFVVVLEILDKAAELAVKVPA